MEAENQNKEINSPSVHPGAFQNKIFFFIFLIATLILVGAGGYYLGKHFDQFPPISINQPKSCTLEVLSCPDGSAVGRSGPKCEFAPCPTLKPTVFSDPTSPTDSRSPSPTPPRPTPLVLPDGSLKVTTYSPLSLELNIPPSIKYDLASSGKYDDWGINLTLSSGTVLTICEGCQLFMKGCNDMSENNNCVSRNIFIGTMPVEENYFKDNPQKIAGYRSTINSMVGKRPLYFIMYTSNNTPLSSKDLNVLKKIFDSLVSTSTVQY